MYAPLKRLALKELATEQPPNAAHLSKSGFVKSRLIDLTFQKVDHLTFWSLRHFTSRLEKLVTSQKVNHFTSHFTG
jgi:hypothetical protein